MPELPAIPSRCDWLSRADLDLQWGLHGLVIEPETLVCLAILIPAGRHAIPINRLEVCFRPDQPISAFEAVARLQEGYDQICADDLLDPFPEARVAGLRRLPTGDVEVVVVTR